MDRIAATFRRLSDRGEKALVMFLTAGDPDLDTSERLLDAVATAGADIIEIGVPFSDPMADGPAIQAASQRALRAGVNLSGILAVVRRIRHRHTQVPLVLFSYYNVLLQYGVERLAADSAKAGIDAWLVVDVPAEEAGEVRPALTRHGLKWITLLAPTTPAERLRLLLAEAEGFVYYITVLGVTGAREHLPADLAATLAGVKALAPVPVVAGFGISGPDTARDVAAHADGAVIGSALVQRIAAAESPDAAVHAATVFTRNIKAALRR